MGRPPWDGDDDFGDSDFDDDYYEPSAFSEFPWAGDDFAQNLYDNMMNTQDWSEAHYWHDILQDYIADQYEVEFDDYFDWQDWRDHYNEAA
jgi:hypothetical protein